MSCLSVCNVGGLSPNSWMDQDEAWHGGRPGPRPHCVRSGHSSHTRKGYSPQFSNHDGFGQTAIWIKMPHGTEVDLVQGHIEFDRNPVAYPPQKKSTAALIFGPCLLWQSGGSRCHLVGRYSLGLGHIALDGDPALPKKGLNIPTHAHFSAPVYCGETAGRIKTPLGTEVDLGLDHIVLDGTQLPPPERSTAAPSFGSCLLWSNGRPSLLLLSTCSVRQHICYCDKEKENIVTAFSTYLQCRQNDWMMHLVSRLVSWTVMVSRDTRPDGNGKITTKTNLPRQWKYCLEASLLNAGVEMQITARPQRHSRSIDFLRRTRSLLDGSRADGCHRCRGEITHRDAPPSGLCMQPTPQGRINNVNLHSVLSVNVSPFHTSPDTPYVLPRSPLNC